MPAASRRGNGSGTSVLSPARSILRRWPKAALTTRSISSHAAGAKGLASGVRVRTDDVTLGGGTNARGGMSNMMRASHNQPVITERRP